MAGGELDGRTALITGSNRGIGRAIAEGLAADGATVAVHAPDAGTATAAASQIGRGARGFGADFADADATAGLVPAVAGALGAVDILVLNASIEIRQPWLEITVDGIRAQQEVNLRATVQLLQAAVPTMRARRWGRVIAIGSVQEHRGNLSHLVYVGHKAAQTAMMMTLARTQGAPDVTFNVVQPGAIHTQRNDDVLRDPQFRDALVAQIPAGRLGAPADIVGMVRLLCAKAGSYVNGAILSIDGGLRL